MRPGLIAAGMLVVLLAPSCAGAAVAAYHAADWAYGLVVPRPGPSAVLLRGLFAAWAGILFCWLLELSAVAAGRAE